MELNEIQNKIKEFVSKRKWQHYHNPKNLSMSIAIESAELMEHFQWLSFEEIEELIKNKQTLKKISEELADVMIYCLSLANALKIKADKAILDKLNKNEKRFKIKS